MFTQRHEHHFSFFCLFWVIFFFAVFLMSFLLYILYVRGSIQNVSILNLDIGPVIIKTFNR